MSGGAAGAPLVMKFGGSAFADLDGYRRTADYLRRRHVEDNRPVVVVVSAMSGTTGRLKEVQEELVPQASAEAAAMLLTTGETVSVALLASALDAVGLPAHALSAAETGLLAEGPADRGELVSVDPAGLVAALEGRAVAVVPGGQAVNAAERTVMLGRNSSDLTAVAIAGSLGCERCELFSDVPGVCTADPHVVPAASVIPRISYAGVRRMSRHGAKVVHERAVDWAERMGVVVHCRPLPPDPGQGTLIGTGPSSPAVIVGRPGELWQFPDRTGCQSAVQVLSGAGMQGAVVAIEGTDYLAVPGGDGSVHRLLGGVALREEDRCLVTVLGADGETEHVLVPHAEAAAEGRRRHGRIFPDQPECVSVGKSRSRHSGLLVGGSGPRAVPAPDVPQSM